MSRVRWTGCLATLLSAALLFPAAGCGKGDDKAKDQQAKEKEKVKEKDKVEPEHGWWCKEHGVVEEDCSLCLPDAEVKKRFKDDWCKLHDRAQSQCFKCDPGLYEKVWEPKYVEKYGKKPERPKAEEFKK